MKRFVPTGAQNVSQRLFWRYASIYACAAIIGVLMALRGAVLPFLGCVPTVSFVFVPLAALAALLTVSNAYAFLLVACKGLFDAQLICRITLFARMGEASFWVWNGCFFLVAASLLLFLLTEAVAVRFSYEHHGRDFKLLLSKPFFCFLLEVMVLTALSAVVFLLWPHLLYYLPTL